MAVYIENETRVQFDFSNINQVIKKAVATVMQDKKIPDELDVNVLITTPSSIKAINCENRDTDSVTDVLSFPYFEYKKPGVFTHKIIKK